MRLQTEQYLTSQVVGNDPAGWRLALLDLALLEGQISPEQAILNSVIEDTLPQ